MRLIVLFIFSSIVSVSFAEECTESTTRVDERLTINRDADLSSNMYHIRLPLKLDGQELQQLALSAHQNVNDEIKELALPLAIKTKGAQTGSYFYISPNWLRVQIIGRYGKDLCTEISSTLSM